jgi:hypothetical protein
VGADDAHLQLKMMEGRSSINGIFFRAGYMKDKLPDDVDILFTPKLNTFRGRTSVQLELKSACSKDVREEILAKIKIEDAIQHEFLTEMLYNIRINSEVVQTVSEADMLDMLKASPQGTLVLTADLGLTRRILDLTGPDAPDVFIRDLPDDERAFNALCAYANRKLPKGYRRIVLAGVPDWFEVPEGAQVYRVDYDSCTRKLMPDVDTLREAYKAIRLVPKRHEDWDEFYMLVHLVESYAEMHYAAATVCVLALDEMKLIDLDFDAQPMTMKIPPMRKVDPDTSAVWRAVQAWKTGI